MIGGDKFTTPLKTTSEVLTEGRKHCKQCYDECANTCVSRDDFPQYRALVDIRPKAAPDKLRVKFRHEVYENRGN
jgi:hypothetical protein